jgi:hypothetical protein
VSFIRLIQAAVVTAAFLVSGPLAGSASAAPQVVAPGHSGTSQYTETLPGAGGETPTEPTGRESAAGAPGGGGRSGGGAGATPAAPTTTESPGTAAVLGAANAKRLEKAGPAGRAAARLAATAGATPEVGKSPGSGGHEASAASPVRQVVSQLTGTSGSEGVGLLLPILIAMSALLALGFVVVRRRGAHPGN